MAKMALYIIFIVFGNLQLAFAQIEEAANSEALLIAYKSQTQASYTDPTEAISLVYNPAEFTGAQLTNADSVEVNNLLAMGEYSVNELNTFVSKKNQYLTAIKKVMRFLKIPIKKQDLVTDTLNNQIYKNKSILISSNTRVTSIQLGFALGAGAQEGFLTSLRKNKLLSFLPADMNYFFASSLGFSIVRTLVNNKFHYSIEGVFETKKGIKTISPYVIAKAGVALSYAIEIRDQPVLYETTQLLKISALNLETNASTIRFSVLAGPSLILGGAIVAGIEGVTERVNFTTTTLMQVVTRQIKSLFKIKMQCAELIGSMK